MIWNARFIFHSFIRCSIPISQSRKLNIAFSNDNGPSVSWALSRMVTIMFFCPHVKRSCLVMSWLKLPSYGLRPSLWRAVSRRNLPVRPCSDLQAPHFSTFTSWSPHTTKRNPGISDNESADEAAKTAAATAHIPLLSILFVFANIVRTYRLRSYTKKALDGHFTGKPLLKTHCRATPNRIDTVFLVHLCTCSWWTPTW